MVLCRRRLLSAAVLLAVAVLAAEAGVTSEYRRKMEATVEMPLDADVFRVPPGYNAPQQVRLVLLLHLCFSFLSSSIHLVNEKEIKIQSSNLDFFSFPMGMG